MDSKLLNEVMKAIENDDRDIDKIYDAILRKKQREILKKFPMLCTEQQKEYYRLQWFRKQLPGVEWLEEELVARNCL